jgi:hypothetical protein
LDIIVSYLDETFVEFDKSTVYPYDMEDAILIWLNQCLLQIKTLELCETEKGEIEDLVLDLHDASVMGWIMTFYFHANQSGISLDLSTGKSTTLREQFQNYQIVERLSLEMPHPIFIPWFPIDMVDVEASLAERKSLHSGNAIVLYVAFLSSILSKVVKYGLAFPNLKNSKRNGPSIGTGVDPIIVEQALVAVKEKELIEIDSDDNLESAAKLQENQDDLLYKSIIDDHESGKESQEGIVAIDVKHGEDEMELVQGESVKLNHGEENKIENQEESSHEEELDQHTVVPRNDPNYFPLGEELTHKDREVEESDEGVLQDGLLDKEASIQTVKETVVKASDSEDEFEKKIVQTLERSLEILKSDRREESRSAHLLRNRSQVLPDIGNSTLPMQLNKQEIVSKLVQCEKRSAIPVSGSKKKHLVKPTSSKGEKIILAPINVHSSPPIDTSTPFNHFPPSFDDNKVAFDSAIDLNHFSKLGPIEAVVEADNFQIQTENDADDEQSRWDIVHEKDAESYHSVHPLPLQIEQVEDEESTEDEEPIPTQGIITVSKNAMNLLLDQETEDDIEEQSNLEILKDQASLLEEESDDDEVDQATLDLIQNIRNSSIESRERVVPVEDVLDETEEEEDNVIKSSSDDELDEPPRFNQVLSRQSSSDESDIDIFQFYEQSSQEFAKEPVSLPESTEKDIKTPTPPIAAPSRPSRPRTGLLSYPIPETDQVKAKEEEAEKAWERAKQAKFSPKESGNKNSTPPTNEKLANKKATLEQVQEIKEKKAKEEVENKKKRDQDVKAKRK